MKLIKPKTIWLAPASRGVDASLAREMRSRYDALTDEARAQLNFDIHQAKRVYNEVCIRLTGKPPYDSELFIVNIATQMRFYKLPYKIGIKNAHLRACMDDILGNAKKTCTK